MLDRGWTVLAIDAEPDAIERLRSRAGDRGALRTELSPMEDVVLPPVDLVWASYSLFFCDPGRFPDVWGRIGAAIGRRRPIRRRAARRPRHVGLPRGPHRDAASGGREALFDGWIVERFEEEENDGEAFDGPKHWHYFHVVAQAPAP